MQLGKQFNMIEIGIHFITNNKNPNIRWTKIEKNKASYFDGETNIVESFTGNEKVIEVR